MTAASVAMAVAAAGEVKSGKTTRLLSGQEWLESLRKRRIVTSRKARQPDDHERQSPEPLLSSEVGHGRGRPGLLWTAVSPQAAFTFLAATMVIAAAPILTTLRKHGLARQPALTAGRET
jgi:hypothetical protein